MHYVAVSENSRKAVDSNLCMLQAITASYAYFDHVGWNPGGPRFDKYRCLLSKVDYE